MRKLLVLALVGLVAQLVDGSLGMAYGVTSTTLLLAVGTRPGRRLGLGAPRRDRHHAGVRACRTGVRQRRLEGRRPDRHPRRGRRLRRRDLPVQPLHRDRRAVMAGILLTLGVYILVRFTLRASPAGNLGKPAAASASSGPLGLVAGFVDATGGGGWGPVAHPGAARLAAGWSPAR